MNQPSSNRLLHETSPYLRQHAWNPVDWYPWSAEAFAEARGRNCPILLSVGYSACHWCHVMEQESFSDPSTAALMNRHFVCVKVDREERPDVDALYMTAVQVMTGRGGWPMTVFLTPDGHPFYAGTYFPPEDRYGLPAFVRVLEAVAEAWARRRHDIAAQAQAIAEDIARSARPSVPTVEPDVNTLRHAVEELARHYDGKHGGFGGAPKFPQPMILDFLLRQDTDAARRMAVKTLGSMARGGVFDQLGGGFHRYATDAEWLVPHFEKMLYDNAQLASVYLRAWIATGDDDLRLVAERTLAYLQQDMRTPCGGFASSEDADSEGAEGLFYTWTPDEVIEALGSESGVQAARRFGVTETGHVDGRSVLHVADGGTRLPRPDDVHVHVMIQRRSQRRRPERDSKILVGWNAMAIAAFAEAAMLTGDDEYLQTARETANLLLERFTYRDADGKLRVYHAGMDSGTESEARTSVTLSPVPGFLEDYALFADALITLYSAAGEPAYLSAAAALADTMLEVFRIDGGLLQEVPADGEQLFAPVVSMEDNAIPSGNAVAVEVCLALGALPVRAHEKFGAWATRAVHSMAALVERHPLAFGRWLCAVDLYLRGVTTIVITGDATQAAHQELVRCVRCSYRPDMVILTGTAAAEAGYVSERPAAYVCRRGTCLPPVMDPDELVVVLRRTA